MKQEMVRPDELINLLLFWRERQTSYGVSTLTKEHELYGDDVDAEAETHKLNTTVLLRGLL